jgi:hypothetical protein
MKDRNPQDRLVAQVREKINRWLPRIVEGHRILGDGTMTCRFDSSTMVSITVDPFLKERSVIQFRVPLLFDVPRSPELFEWMADSNCSLRPGAIKGIPTLAKDDLVHLFFVYEILGDDVYFEEFSFGIALATASTLNFKHADIRAKFGGESAALPEL